VALSRRDFAAQFQPGAQRSRQQVDRQPRGGGADEADHSFYGSQPHSLQAITAEGRTRTKQAWILPPALLMPGHIFCASLLHACALRGSGEQEAAPPQNTGVAVE